MTASLVSLALLLVVFAELFVLPAFEEVVLAMEAASLDFAAAVLVSPLAAAFLASVAFAAVAFADDLVSLAFAAVSLALFLVSLAFWTAVSVFEGIAAGAWAKAAAEVANAMAAMRFFMGTSP